MDVQLRVLVLKADSETFQILTDSLKGSQTQRPEKSKKSQILNERNFTCS